jgi:hypothetical protein
VAAVGGNQKIPGCRGAIGEGDAHARVVFMDAFDALAELHLVAPPEVQHFALKFSARDGAGAPAGTLNQRGKAKAGQGIAAPVILVGHKTHRPAVGLDDVAHAEVLHAFHAVRPDGDGRPDGPDLFTASNTVQSMPAFFSATAALRPPIPAPMTIAFMLLSFCRV